MHRLTGDEINQIEELKRNGFGVGAISRETRIPKDTISYHYYPRKREYSRTRRRNQTKAESPERYEFISFIEDYDAGTDVTIGCGNYCAQILLFLSGSFEFGKRCRTMKREIGKNVG